MLYTIHPLALQNHKHKKRELSIGEIRVNRHDEFYRVQQGRSNYIHVSASHLPSSRFASSLLPIISSLRTEGSPFPLPQHDSCLDCFVVRRLQAFLFSSTRVEFIPPAYCWADYFFHVILNPLRESIVIRTKHGLDYLGRYVAVGSIVGFSYYAPPT